MKLKGIIPPILTSFDEKGKIDFKRLEKFAEFLRPHVQGFYVNGTYGSGVLMNVAERKSVFEALSSYSDGSFELIAHVGTTNLRDSIELAQHAEIHRALAVAAVPPFYFRYSEESLFAFFKDLIQSVAVPVYLYDNPGATGNPLSADLINRLAAVGLAGVKDSTFDISKTYMVMRTIKKEGFDVVIGSESLFLPAYMQGSRACISGLANTMPELMQKLFCAAESNDFLQATTLQRQVLEMWDILHYGPSTATAYAMLKVRGMDAGFPRRPFLPIGKDLYEKIESAMKANEAIWKI
ncbi:MAG TPA: dihydrodipicolinate synthase family protein [Anaerolineaceae bacterium]|nr:dihydrodipicolinate synthase family protein [Anaerolineaceae bacterium]